MERASQAVPDSLYEVSDVDDPEPPLQTPRRAKQPKYVRLQSLPNVHAGIHFQEVVLEYSTVMNCNVLAGEMKHKFFHRLADTASPSNPMAYLFAHDATRQSIRLGLAGAWSYDYPVLQEPLKLVENLCPKLTKSFLLISHAPGT